MEQCDQKILSLSDKFQMIMYGLGYDLAFLRYFPEVKREKWNQKD